MTAREFFQNLNKNTLESVEVFYAPNVEFHDPVVAINSASRLRAYFAHQYQDVNFIKWEFQPDVVQGDTTVLVWKMIVSHPRIRGGETIAVDGSSLVRFQNGKAVYHRDYFDMGAFVYENIPVLRNVIGLIKNKMASSY